MWGKSESSQEGLYTLNKIKKEILSQINIVPKRPGIGISPLDIDKVYGKRLQKFKRRLFD